MIKEAINNDAWAIMPSSLDNISSKVIEGVVDPVISEISEDASNDRASYIEARAAFMSQFEEKLQVDEDGTGYISIDGPMMLNPGPFERMVIGAADMGRISELVRVAAGEEEINSLVLNINSPGGTVVGTPELAQSIRDFNANRASGLVNRHVIEWSYHSLSPTVEQNLLGNDFAQSQNLR